MEYLPIGIFLQFEHCTACWGIKIQELAVFLFFKAEKIRQSRLHMLAAPPRTAVRTYQRLAVVHDRRILVRSHVQEMLFRARKPIGKFLKMKAVLVPVSTVQKYYPLHRIGNTVLSTYVFEDEIPSS